MNLTRKFIEQQLDSTFDRVHQISRMVFVHRHPQRSKQNLIPLTSNRLYLISEQLNIGLMDVLRQEKFPFSDSPDVY